MFLMRQSPYAPLAEVIMGQMNQSRLDLQKLIRMEPRLKGLEFLGSLWEEYGLWQDNGYLYQLTEAGQFWQVNMTQTLLESVEHLLGGSSQIHQKKVAAQG